MPVDNDIFADINPTPQKATGEKDIFADEKQSARVSIAPSAAPVTAKAPPAPLTVDVARNSMVRAIAGAGDAVLNTPQNLVNLGKMRIGQMMMDAGIHPDNAPQPSPPPNYLTRGAEAIGLIKPNVVPQGAAQKAVDFATGGATAAMLTPARSVPELMRNLFTGVGSGLAGGGVTEATGNPIAGQITSMMVPSMVSGIVNRANRIVDERAAAQQANAVNDATLAAAKDRGYVVPPAETNPSFLNNRLEGFAGKAATRQEAMLRNQPITNQIAREELGLPPNTPITSGTLETFRNNASGPYREVAQLSPMASNALEDLRRSRQQAQSYWKFYERSADPKAQAQAEALDARAQMLERVIERQAAQNGKPGLIDDLRAARQQIAKSYDIERALNVGDANVSAPAIGRRLDSGVPLSGGLKDIGQFAEGPGRRFVTEASRVPAPGVSGGEIYGMAGMGALGSAAAGPIGVAAGGIPLLRGPVRNLLLSNTYQNSSFANPNYNPGLHNRVISSVPQFSPQDLALMSLLQATKQ